MTYRFKGKLLAIALTCLIVPAAASAQVTTIRTWMGTLSFEASQTRMDGDATTNITIKGNGRVNARDVIATGAMPSVIWPNAMPTDSRFNEIIKAWTGLFEYNLASTIKSGMDKGTKTEQIQNPNQPLEMRITLTRKDPAKPPTNPAEMFDAYGITVSLPISLNGKCTTDNKTYDCPVGMPRGTLLEVPPQPITPKSTGLTGKWEGSYQGYAVKIMWTLAATAAR
jgi:hypothetical protein